MTKMRLLITKMRLLITSWRYSISASLGHGSVLSVVTAPAVGDHGHAAVAFVWQSHRQITDTHRSW